MVRSARRVEVGGSARHIGLFGIYGAGNYGNDESARALAALLREHDESVRITLLVPHAEGVAAAFDFSAIGFQRDAAHRDPMSRIVSKLREFQRIYTAVGQFDQAVVCGSGVLQHVRGRWPGGVLTWMLALSMACRLRRVPLAWFAVGGSPSMPVIPRLVARLAAWGASYRSYRDEMTAASLGDVAKGSAVVSDVVFSRAEALEDRRSSGRQNGPILRIGLSVMDYDPPTDEMKQRYLETLVSVGRKWLAAGAEIVFLLGDSADEPMTRLVADRVHSEDLSRVRIVHGPFEKVLKAASECDVVVASRYHVLIAGALAHRPLVALSHMAKDDALMDRLGLAPYVLRAGALDDRELREMVETAFAEVSSSMTCLTTALPELHAVVRTEFERSGLGDSAYRRV